uniref:protein-tyrosine-phosphatase n=1 Tax=Geotrypetes seraphini TaxID=260995 RepID=A0A6P8PG18_GEOSA|nr:tyrosine-protein phosphatase non-receptor type 22 isoform X2 [Geotrypetes seraphini]
MNQEEILRRYLETQSKQQGTDSFAQGFLKLKRLSAKYKTDKTYSTTAAEMPENLKKNRYKDILPFDHSRVQLSLITSDNDSDYINANFIKGVYGPRGYIATQGPLPHTVLDFWRLIWEYKVLIVVMACMEFEMGKKKCERYWPDVGKDAFECGPFFVTCEAEINKVEYVIRTLKIQFYSNTRIAYQFHYKNWPDHDVPSSIDPILGMIESVRLYQEDDSTPLCVHCSAGCGRTGVLCAIDFTWKMLKDGIIPENFSIYSLILEMRTQRSSLVQTKEQYALVYQAISELFKRQLEITAGPDPGGSDISPNHPRTDPVLTPVASPDEITLPNSVLEEKKKTYQDEHMEQRRISSPMLSSLTLSNLLERDLCSLDKSPPCKTAELKNYISEVSSVDMTWENVSSFDGRPLQKHHSVDFDNLCFSNLHPSLLNPGADGRSYRRKSPLTRAKSSPFESTQCRETNNLGQWNTALPLGFQFSNFHDSGELNIKEKMSSSSKEWNNLGQKVDTILHYVNCRPTSNLYIRLTEDPYFSPTSSSDLGSPRFPDVCTLATLSKSTNELGPGEMVGMGASVSSPVASPKSRSLALDLPDLSTHAAQSGNTKESVKISPDPDEENPPPLPERTPESYIVAREEETRQSKSKAQLLHKNLKFGTSLEWSGTSHSKTWADSIKSMARSKSVKVRSSKLERARDRSPSPPPLPERTRESLMIASEDDIMQTQSEESAVTAANFSGEVTAEDTTPLDPVKRWNRSKSLKIFQNVKKSFGIRFCKPKGPRNPPPTWDI